jgi:hypothetical protein
VSGNKSVSPSDLTHEPNTDRGIFDPQAHLEKAELAGKARGLTFRIKTEVHAGSPQGIAVTTVLLGGIGLAITGVAFGIGVVAIPALAIGLCAPVATYVLIRLVSGRWTR